MKKFHLCIVYSPNDNKMLVVSREGGLVGEADVGCADEGAGGKCEDGGEGEFGGEGAGEGVGGRGEVGGEEGEFGEVIGAYKREMNRNQELIEQSFVESNAMSKKNSLLCNKIKRLQRNVRKHFQNVVNLI